MEEIDWQRGSVAASALVEIVNRAELMNKGRVNEKDFHTPILALSLTRSPSSPFREKGIEE
jgi:hypothetical protein